MDEQIVKKADITREALIRSKCTAMHFCGTPDIEDLGNATFARGEISDAVEDPFHPVIHSPGVNRSRYVNAIHTDVSTIYKKEYIPFQPRRKTKHIDVGFPDQHAGGAKSSEPVDFIKVDSSKCSSACIHSGDVCAKVPRTDSACESRLSPDGEVYIFKLDKLEKFVFGLAFLCDLLTRLEQN